MRLHAEQVEQQLALVVGRAAGAQHVAVQGGVERIGVPQLERVDGLDVVVAVDEDGRGVGVVAAPFGVDSREPRAVVEELGGREAGAPSGVDEPFRAAADVGMPVGLGADARDPQPGVKVVEQVLLVVVDVVAFAGHQATITFASWRRTSPW